MADDGSLAEATQPLSFSEFLERMKEPAAADLVRNIKQFIKTFEDRTPDPVRDSALVQEFLLKSEAAFRSHPVWASAPPEHQQQAIEGLEKYLMTKIYGKTFGVAAEDRERDGALAARMAALNFVRPEHLDIPELYQDQKAWLLAIKELHKINNYKAPRDKLVCILNCCRVINNLLHVGIQDGQARGADDFLPVLIYVVIHANPPQLASNLLYIERFRMQSRMQSESAYFFTQLYSAASFVETINANSLTMEPDEFLARMISAGIADLPTAPQPAVAAVPGPGSAPGHAAAAIADHLANSPHANSPSFGQAVSPSAGGAYGTPTQPAAERRGPFGAARETPASNGPAAQQSTLSPLPPGSTSGSTPVGHAAHMPAGLPPSPLAAPGSAPAAQPAAPPPVMPYSSSGSSGPPGRALSVAELEAEGVPAVLAAHASGELQRRHRFLFAATPHLRVSDVALLLADYKELVLRYEALSRAVAGRPAPSPPRSALHQAPAAAPSTLGYTPPQPAQPEPRELAAGIGASPRAEVDEAAQPAAGAQFIRSSEESALADLLGSATEQPSVPRGSELAAGQLSAAAEFDPFGPGGDAVSGPADGRVTGPDDGTGAAAPAPTDPFLALERAASAMGPPSSGLRMERDAESELEAFRAELPAAEPDEAQAPSPAAHADVLQQAPAAVDDSGPTPAAAAHDVGSFADDATAMPEPEATAVDPVAAAAQPHETDVSEPEYPDGGANPVHDAAWVPSWSGLGDADAETPADMATETPSQPPAAPHGAEPSAGGTRSDHADSAPPTEPGGDDSAAEAAAKSHGAAAASQPQAAQPADNAPRPAAAEDKDLGPEPTVPNGLHVSDDLKAEPASAPGTQPPESDLFAGLDVGARPGDQGPDDPGKAVPIDATAAQGAEQADMSGF